MRLTNQLNSAYSTVQPGQNAVVDFDFYLNPSQECRTNQEAFNLVMGQRQWLNPGAVIYWYLTEPCYGASFVSYQAPAHLLPGNTSQNTIHQFYKNTGGIPWYSDGLTRVATSNGACSPFYSSSTWISCNRATGSFVNTSVPGKQQIDPGETGEFTFILNVPATMTPGTYSQGWTLVEEGAASMGGTHTETYSVL
jgi:hypothetical protein